jgi:murein DD-endopeptidase
MAHKLFRRHLTDRGIIKPLFAAALSALLSLLQAQAQSQSPSAFPVEITAAHAPQPVMADGRLRLAYELHLIDFSPKPIELNALEVFGADPSAPLASYHGDALQKLLVAVGPTDTAGNVRKIGGGRSVVIFLDLTLDAGSHPPAELHHRLTLSIPGKDSAPIEMTVKGPVVPVVHTPAPVLRAPLHGSSWFAANGLFNPEHRRSLVPVDGKVRIAQRFAIDWIQFGPDGRFFHGDSKSNANFYGYGAEVLAVADGRISDLKDGLPQNAGDNEPATRAITLDNIAGNYLILDLGQSRFALYAHLQPGSLKVKLGDEVKAGQVLALLGNSGNSDAPHLHFHLMDANSPLASEGIPYELETFVQQGIVDNPDVLDTGVPWQPKTPAAPIVHRQEFPIDNAVVAFP